MLTVAGEGWNPTVYLDVAPELFGTAKDRLWAATKYTHYFAAPWSKKVKRVEEDASFVITVDDEGYATKMRLPRRIGCATVEFTWPKMSWATAGVMLDDLVRGEDA